MLHKITRLEGFTCGPLRKVITTEGVNKYQKLSEYVVPSFCRLLPNTRKDGDEISFVVTYYFLCAIGEYRCVRVKNAALALTDSQYCAFFRYQTTQTGNMLANMLKSASAWTYVVQYLTNHGTFPKASVRATLCNSPPDRLMTSWSIT